MVICSRSRKVLVLHMLLRCLVYTGFFHDNGKKVPIPMLQTYRTEYERMGLGRYLTIHPGSRIAAQGHQEYDARQWSWHYYSALVQLLKTRYLDCHSCYCLYDNLLVCARGMKRPECMEKLVPELVMEHAAAYLDSIYADG